MLGLVGKVLFMDFFLGVWVDLKLRDLVLGNIKICFLIFWFFGKYFVFWRKLGIYGKNFFVLKGKVKEGISSCWKVCGNIVV